jgi:FkbM family methyltransferase
MLLSRWTYYLSSIPTLLFGVRNIVPMLRMFLPLPGRQPFVLELRNGLRFRVRSAMDIWIIKETCLDRDYERESVALGQDWTVIDIGAGLGDFTVHAAHHSARGTVYAFEPTPESFRLLEENLRLNQIRNVQPQQLAIGSAPLMVLKIDSGVPVRFSTAEANGSSGGQTSVEVRGAPLDEVIAGLPISRCDLLKIDCEGAEYDIFFHTSPDTFRKIDRICMEYHNNVTPYSHLDLMDFFVKQGYIVKHAPNPAHREIGFLYAYRPDA